MIYYKSGLVAEDFVNHIIERGESYPITEGGIGNGEQPFVDKEKRSCDIHWIPPTAENAEIVNFSNHFACEINRYKFGFEYRCTADFQYTVYNADVGGHYGWHIDTFGKSMDKAYDRKFTVIVQLSDPSEYEGGEFQLHPSIIKNMPPQDELKVKGTIIAFPSYLVHRATKVTNGTRKALVFWAEGPPFC